MKMRKVKVKELSRDAFYAYGTYSNMIDPEAEKIGKTPIEFYRDMVPLDLGSTSTASFSVCRVDKRPLEVNIVEYHDGCGEGILPLDADVLIHVAPASAPGEVPLDKIEVFRVPKGTFVSLRSGVWHHAPYVVDREAANVLIVLPERTYAMDCEVFEIPEADRMVIEA
jgi:ureidoglycolate lyase